MKPTSISYSESKESFDISTGLKSWRKAGVEIELDDSSVEKAFDEARKIVGDALAIQYKNIPGFEMETRTIPTYPPITFPTLPTIDYSAKERIEQAIDNADCLSEMVLMDSDAEKYGLTKLLIEKRIKVCKTPHELDLLMGDIAKHQLVPKYLEKKKSLK